MLEQFHIGLGIVSLLLSGLVAYFGMMIKNSLASSNARLIEQQTSIKEELIHQQTSVKEELVRSQTAMRMDMDEKHAENKQAIAVHVASDEKQFDAISRTLTRIDGKLDRMNGH